jgi:DHA3 family tetracycline resistance protein-like MFS transporter
MPETGFTRTPKDQRENWRQMTSTFMEGIKLAKSKTILLTFVVIAIFVGLYSEGYDRLSEAHFLAQFSFPKSPWGGDPIVTWFALLRVFGLLLSMGTIEVVKRKVNLKDNAQIALWLQGIYALISFGLLIFAWSKSFYMAFLASLTVNVMRSLTFPLVDTWVNQHIESKVRATMLSMTAQLDALGQMVGGPFVGFIGNLRSIRAAITTSSIILLPVIPLYRKTMRQSEETTNLHE